MTDEGAVPADPWRLPRWMRWSDGQLADAAAEREASRRPATPGPNWLPSAALFAGVVGAVAIPGAPPGLGVAVTAVAVAAALVPALRARLNVWTVACGTLALALAGLAVVRDAEWLVALDLVAALAVGSIVLAGGSNFRELMRGAVSLLIASPMAPAYIAKPVAARVTRAPVRRWGPAARGAVVSVGLLAVFGALFASADRAFGELAAALVPAVSLDLIPARVAVFLFVVGAVSAGAVVAARVEPVGISAGLHRLAALMLAPLDPARVSRRPSRLEWVLPLALLDALFAVFVGVQFAVFFGGREHLLATPGLTAAEYARSGFFQLLAVCLLTLAVIATTVSWVDAAERRLLRVLFGPLCALTGVVLVSAALRLHHYQEAFGYTRLRMVVSAVMAVIAVALLLVLIAGATWRVSWLPRAVLVTGVAALLTLNIVNADAFIAARNIDRASAGATLDTAYLSGLSADAVPTLLRLPEPARSCVLDGMRDRRALTGDGGWRGLNLARNRARSVFADTRIDC